MNSFGALTVPSTETLHLISFRKLVLSYDKARGEQPDAPEGNGRILSGSMSDSFCMMCRKLSQTFWDSTRAWVGFRERGSCGKQEGSVLPGSISFLTAKPRKITLCEIQYFGHL